ncbi:uncharacterized protein EAE98_006439 [Botrytis deweyae]|uniref:Uncharacterized protein n=1 Tax=Botrytis deweyae TaxID=2478750 RepID=A0ABQ7IJC1_9HELO|nr:uncharacterized protein EAE98_006439 [Botrytis deweyae]KAF7926144.1 hypothetical protein EAE98_006439 [Botrytis deweyae]
MSEICSPQDSSALPSPKASTAINPERVETVKREKVKGEAANTFKRATSVYLLDKNNMTPTKRELSVFIYSFI